MLTTDAAGAGFRVVVAGGGVAGLEAVLALRELAGDRVAVTLLAPTTEFVYRPQAVREPFALGPADRYDLREMADDLGAELVVDRLSWIDPAGHMAHTSGATRWRSTRSWSRWAPACSRGTRWRSRSIRSASTTSCTDSSRTSRAGTSAASPSSSRRGGRGCCRRMSWRL
jgi:hypothetical protein